MCCCCHWLLLFLGERLNSSESYNQSLILLWFVLICIRHFERNFSIDMASKGLVHRVAVSLSFFCIRLNYIIHLQERLHWRSHRRFTKAFLAAKMAFDSDIDPTLRSLAFSCAV